MNKYQELFDEIFGLNEITLEEVIIQRLDKTLFFYESEMRGFEEEIVSSLKDLDNKHLIKGVKKLW